MDRENKVSSQAHLGDIGIPIFIKISTAAFSSKVLPKDNLQKLDTQSDHTEATDMQLRNSETTWERETERTKGTTVVVGKLTDINIYLILTTEISLHDLSFCNGSSCCFLLCSKHQIVTTQFNHPIRYPLYITDYSLTTKCERHVMISNIILH